MTAGSIVSVDDSGRVTFPSSLISIVEWWSKEKKTVMAELSEYGLFRIYKLEDVAPHIDKLRSELEDLEPASRVLRKAALEDRYRGLTLYADGRLQLTREVASWVGAYPFPSTTSYLFADAFALGMSIFTLDYRASRLAGLGLPLHDGYLRQSGH